MVCYWNGDLNSGQFVHYFLAQWLIGASHLNNGWSEYRTSKSLLFRCFRYSDVCYSGPHCMLSVDPRQLLFWFSSFKESSSGIRSGPFKQVTWFILRSLKKLSAVRLISIEEFAWIALITTLKKIGLTALILIPAIRLCPVFEIASVPIQRTTLIGKLSVVIWAWFWKI